MVRKKDLDAAVGESLVCRNLRALKRYEVEERLEAGLVLQGSEVKSLRAGRADLEGSYGSVDKGELFLHKMYIAPYENAGYQGHETRQSRKLLVNKRQLHRIESRLATRGYTIIPLQVYFKKGWAKVEIGLAKGRKQGDKRHEIRRTQEMKEAREMVKRRNRG